MSTFQTFEWNISAFEPCLPPNILGKLGFNLQWFTSHKPQSEFTALPRSASHSPLPKKLTAEASHFHPRMLADFLLRQPTTPLRGQSVNKQEKLSQMHAKHSRQTSPARAQQTWP